MASDNKLWLVPLTVTVTAYVSAPDDRDAETIENIAQGAIGLHSKTFGVMLDHDNTMVGEAVEAVEYEPLEDVIRQQVAADSTLPYSV